MPLLASMVIGYLIGSLPFPYLLGKAKGVNLFTLGTRNPGAANLYRRVSRPLGIVASLLDMAKGAAPVFIASSLGVPPGWTLLAGAAAMVGHWYSVFLRFRGGEALATVLGVGLGVDPVAALAAAAVGIALLLALKSTGHAAGFAWPVFVAIALLRGTSWHAVAGVTALAVIVTVRSQVRAKRNRSV